MSNISDFFGAGGVQIGDYVQTERTTGLLAADGQDIFGLGYTDLEALMTLSNKVNDVAYIQKTGLYRTTCIQAHGLLGYRGKDTTGTIEQLDYLSNTVTEVDTSSSASTGYYHSCCSDIGNRIFFLGANTGNNDLFVVVSEDNGTTWTDYAIFTSGFSGLSGTTDGSLFQGGLIQCDVTGDNLRVVFFDFTTTTTLVYESTDVGQTWSEILTSRKTLTNGQTTGNGAVSRDLSTTIQADDTFLYISTGGTGTLTDRASAFPGTLDIYIRYAISDDGEDIAAWNARGITLTKLIGAINFFTTPDGGVTWSEYILPVSLPADSPNFLAIATMYFDPDDNNILIAVVQATTTGSSDENVPGAIFVEINISNFTTDVIGELPFLNIPITPNIIHFQSDFKSNGTGFTYGVGDSSGIDSDYSVEIVKGILLKDSRSAAIPSKILTGTQANGAGTLGYSWERLTSPLPVDYDEVYVSTDKAIICMGGAFGTIITSVNSGTTFVDKTSAAGYGGSHSIYAMDGSDSSSLIIASSRGEVRFSTNDGVSWTGSTGLSDTGSASIDEYQCLSCIADGTTVIAGSKNGNLDISTNSGTSFSLLATPFSSDPTDEMLSGCIARDDDQIIIVGNTDGLIRRSTNGGSSFSLPSTPPVGSIDESKVFDMKCSADGSIVIAAISDKLFLSTDTGDTWAEVAVGFSKVSYRNTSITDDGTKIFATNGDGVLMRSLDSGVTFNKTLVPWEATRRKACPTLSTDGTLAYVGTDDGLIYRTT